MNVSLRWLVLSLAILGIFSVHLVQAEEVAADSGVILPLTPIKDPYRSIWLKKNDGHTVELTPDQLSDQDQRLLLNAAKGRLAKKPTAGATSQIVSIEITKGKPPFDHSKKYDPLGSESMKLKLLVSCPGKHIISFDESASELKQLDDDQGTNLLADELGHGKASFFPFIEIYHGGDQAMITIESPRKPVAGTKNLRLKANLVLQSTLGEKTVEKKDVDIKKGDTLMLGRTKVTVSPKGSSGPNMIGAMFGQMLGAQREKAAMMVYLSFQSPVDLIKRIQFFDTDGKPIKHREEGSSSSGTGDNCQYDVEYALTKKVDKLTVKITYFDKVEEINVPVSVATGLGL